MTEAEDFSHGSYGDYSGAAFYGPPTNGFWFDRLAVSDRYLSPLFAAVLDRSQARGSEPPQLVRDWNALDGWIAADGIVEMPRPAAEELLHALTNLTAADVYPYCAGCTADDCFEVRCDNHAVFGRPDRSWGAPVHRA